MKNQQKKEKIKKVIFFILILWGLIFLNGEKISISQGTQNQTAEEKNIFTLYNQDGETYQPIAGTKFKITDLEGKSVTDINGKIVGELETINGKEDYILTTDENGFIKANLPKGIYQAIEVAANEAYILEEEEENRTYYFEVETTELVIPQWIQGSLGYSWNTIGSTIENTKGEVMAVGSISEYSPEISGISYNGVDLNSDGIIEEISQGEKDGILVSYDEKGNYLWSKTLGGIYDDVCKQILQTTDGGYVVIGYTESPIFYLDGKIITDLSKSDYEMLGKDGFLLKLTEKGEYEWGVRIGGNLEDEIEKIIQTKDGNIVIIGNFSSNSFHFYENSTSHEMKKEITNEGEVSSFLASYSPMGKYNWSQKIGGNEWCKTCDITELENNIVVAVNYKGTLNIQENKMIESNQKEETDGLLIEYSSKGEYIWHYEIYAIELSSYATDRYVEITAITGTKDNQLIVATCVAGILKEKNEQNKEIFTCESNGLYANLIILSNKGEFIQNIYDLNSVNVTSYATKAAMIFSDIVITSNNEVLVGGYYYSDKNIDVDKDGSKTGERDFLPSNGNTSNGFWLKLDKTGKIIFSDCLCRKDRMSFSSSSVTSVQESKTEKVIIGGNFYWHTLTTKNFYSQYIEDESNDFYYLNRIGNREGFILVEDTQGGKREILEEKRITIDNFKKKCMITTEVKSHFEKMEDGEEREVKGGKISGDYNQTIDGTEYTEEGVHYVEEVTYGEASTKEIVITPEKGYQIRQILWNGEVYTNYQVDDNGIVTIPILEAVKSNQHITVEFTKILTGLHELPITGGKFILFLDFLGGVFICLGIGKLLKRK